MRARSGRSSQDEIVVTHRRIVQCPRTLGSRKCRALRLRLRPAPIGRKDPVRAGAEPRAAADRQRLLGQEERRESRECDKLSIVVRRLS